tara:strand:+ start:39102 stop:39503 length:402 start_codon:yes stop_codon:yes gene_type:complete
MLKEIDIIEANKGLQYFMDSWNKTQEDSIVYVSIDGFERSKDFDSLVLDIFDNDDTVGFVYTDFFIYDSNGLNIAQFLDDKNLPSIPFFVKKKNNLNMQFVQEQNIISSMMQMYINHGYKFEHLAENCLGHVV